MTSYSTLIETIRLSCTVFTARGYAKRGICRRRVSLCVSVCLSVCLSHSGIVSQVALLSQRDRATCLSVEILHLQNIAIVWHYLRDPTFSRFDTIPECDRQTHTHTDTRRRHIPRLARRRAVKTVQDRRIVSIKVE